MIFVTVGSGSFDRLIRVIDKNADRIGERIIFQIGKGGYIPKNCEWFRFKDNLNEEYSKANLVIAHAGAGTTFELLEMGKKVISVANLRGRTDRHQQEVADALSEEGYLLRHKNPDKIIEDIEKAKKLKFKRYKRPECRIHEVINQFLDNL